MQPVVVYDTNILISGMIWGGIPYDCIALAEENKVEGLTCDEILNEFADKFITKFGFSLSETSEVVTDFLSFLRTVEISNDLKAINTDSDDNKILECAIVGEATHIVTGDKKHLLRLQSYQDILIVSAADFLAQFQK